jgi:ABC-type transport system involved in multi-copper enzyme maturation permease subunit
MKTLLWKDFRQNGRMLVAVAVFLVLPYLIAVGIGVLAKLRTAYGITDPYSPHPSWRMLIGGASIWGLILGVIACAFVAGNAVTGERADRSAEFIAYLPISRGVAIASKALLAIAVCLLIPSINLLIGVVSGLFHTMDHKFAEMLYAVGVTLVLLFGSSWFFSTLLRSPAIATACGLATILLLVGTLMLFDFVRGVDEAYTLERWFPLLCLLLGPSLFVVGVVHYLRCPDP